LGLIKIRYTLYTGFLIYISIMNIKKFEIFLEEVRLKDVVKLKGFDSHQIDKWGFNKTFDLTKKLVKHITPSTRINGKKIRLTITYFDDALHNIRWKISKRTNLESVEEFNDILKKSINNLLNQTTNFNFDEKLALYISEYNFSIIFKIDLEMLEFNIYTIIPGRGVSNIKNIFVV
jgi:hypothetical protein